MFDKGEHWYFCLHYYLTYVSMGANSVDLDQTAPTLFVKKAITFQQMTKVDNFYSDWLFQNYYSLTSLFVGEFCGALRDIKLPYST